MSALAMPLEQMAFNCCALCSACMRVSSDSDTSLAPSVSSFPCASAFAAA
eukprot:CAMPEP_0179471368 /NCGR_PEP_ID=MMETSP0799-20121207/51609_2 /TAXON_ID=46947 /ORGANISM="Geminigera cryophila, Strain CCMP2564" /LENGTH=49 /DNA_ID= /DNA_START= /DNA_END= /DNA_ORIENTATION=